MSTCKFCDQPCKPRKDRPGKFFTFCDEHYAEYMRGQAKAEYERAKERCIARARKWQKANPKSARAGERRRTHRRRAGRLADAIGFYMEEQLQSRIDFYGRCCWLCGCDWDALGSFDQTVDHVIPLDAGGTNWPANLRPACRSCNSSRGARQTGPSIWFSLSSFAPWSRMIQGPYVGSRW